jgi:hypothetical protein
MLCSALACSCLLRRASIDAVYEVGGQRLDELVLGLTTQGRRAVRRTLTGTLTLTPTLSLTHTLTRTRTLTHNSQGLTTQDVPIAFTMIPFRP